MFSFTGCEIDLILEANRCAAMKKIEEKKALAREQNRKLRFRMGPHLVPIPEDAKRLRTQDYL